MNKKQTNDIEKIMLRAGRVITGLPQCAMVDAVRGELGWCTMEERREVAKLKYFHRLRTLPDNRLVKRVFMHRMNEAREQGIKNYNAEHANPQRRTGWCNEMFRIMLKYDIVEQWNVNVEEKDNVAVWRWWMGIKEKVEKKQEEEWRMRLMKRKKGPFYLKCKNGWGVEEYLNEKGSKKGRIWKTRMRASAIPLQAEMKREHHSLIDTCGMCYDGSVENHMHMLVECTAYEERWSWMFES